MRAFADRHPNLVTWLVLAVGMLVVLYWSARDVDLTGRQLFWLGAATVLLAGLCAWIISWEADEPEDDGVEPSGGDKTIAQRNDAGGEDGGAGEAVAEPDERRTGDGGAGPVG